MLTHDEIREELIRQLDDGRWSAKDVAARLNIAPARVSEMRKRTRKVQQREMPILADLLGMQAAGQSLTQPVTKTVKIPHLGKVAQGVWLEQTFMHPDEPEFADYDTEAEVSGVGDLFSVTPEGASMNLVFRKNSKLICRTVPFGAGTYRSGDYVVAQRTAHDLYEMTVKRVEIDQNGDYWLHSESDNPQFKDPWRIGQPDSDHHEDTEITILGKVVREIISYE